MDETKPTISLATNAEGPTLGLDTAQDALAVESFGDYVLTSEIARGGMGVVFRGRQVKLNRPVAVKMLLAGSFATATDRERFRQEAEAVAGLEHPNILPIYEVGEQAGRAFFSMKLIEGGTLATRLAAKPPTRELIDLLAKICRAVDYAHRRGILHRDLKPSNVLINEAGTPYVTDFGLAKKTDGEDLLTKTGAVIGTPSYMAPEQARGEKGLTTSVDIYSLAAILYEALAGKPPFGGETVMATLRKVIDESPADPRTSVRDADRDLSIVALKGLAKEPQQRYASAASLADDLERWLRGEAVTARATTRRERLRRWTRKNPGIAALTAGLAAALLVGSFVSFSFAMEARSQKRSAEANLNEVLRLAGETNIALVDAYKAKQNALTEQGKAQDALGRSRFEQARALRLAAQPGWRQGTLSNLTESATLLLRSEHLREGLPTLAELRGEAIQALSRSDAVKIRSIPSGITDNPVFSGDGKLFFSKFSGAVEGKMIFGYRSIDAETGTERDSKKTELVDRGTTAPSVESMLLMTLASSPLVVDQTGSRFLFRGMVSDLLILYDPIAGKAVQRFTDGEPSGLPIGASCPNFALANDGRSVLAWHLKDKSLRLLQWDVAGAATPRVLKEAPVPAKGTVSKPKCGWTPQGEIWHVDPAGATLTIVKAAAEPVVIPVSTIDDVAWHPTEPLLALDLITAGTRSIVLWNLAEGREVARQPLVDRKLRAVGTFGTSGTPAAFSHSGELLAVAAGGDRIAIFDSRTLQPRHSFATGVANAIQSVQWSATDELFVKPLIEPVQVWQLREDRDLQRRLEPDRGGRATAISPDSRWWAFAAARNPAGGVARKEAVFYDAREGKYLAMPQGLDSTSLCFRSDSAAVLGVVKNQVVELSLPEGRELRRWKMPEREPFTDWGSPFYLSGGDPVCRLMPPPGSDTAAPLILWNLKNGAAHFENAELKFARMSGESMLVGGSRVVFTGEGANYDLIARQKLRDRKPLAVLRLADGQLERAIPLPASTGVTILDRISHDGRWLLAVNFTMTVGADIALNESNAELFDLDTGQGILRRAITPYEDNLLGRFARTEPILALMPDANTVELWHLGRTELLSRWQPYGSRKIADLGFTGDTLYLREDGRTSIDLLPLPTLRTHLQGLGLGW